MKIKIIPVNPVKSKSTIETKKFKVTVKQGIFTYTVFICGANSEQDAKEKFKDIVRFTNQCIPVYGCVMHHSPHINLVDHFLHINLNAINDNDIITIEQEK